MIPFDFLVPKRPLSYQAKDGAHKAQWKEFVYGRAYATWKGLPVSQEYLRFCLVYLCEDDPPDINNIIKPVQDALNGLVYCDDNLVIDVQGHLRMVGDLIDVTGLPRLLQDAIVGGVDCVYVRIDESKSLNKALQ